MAKKYRLLVESGVQADQSWENCPAKFTVGSAASCDLILIDCAPDSSFELSLEKNTVEVSRVGDEKRRIPYSEVIELSDGCSIRFEKIEPAFISQVSQSVKSVRNVPSLKALNWFAFGLVGSFVITAAIASDFLSGSSSADVWEKTKQHEVANKREKARPVANFDQTPVVARSFGNGELEKQFGCNKDCFNRDQIAALFPGEHGSIQMKDGRKLNVGSVVIEGLAISAIGDNYVLFTDGNQSIRVDVF
jgi:hypothetical protein